MKILELKKIIESSLKKIYYKEVVVKKYRQKTLNYIKINKREFYVKIDRKILKYLRGEKFLVGYYFEM